MRIGLIDVDGHNFPNLALMKISEYHKQRGDTVEWWWTDIFHYDIVYMSKVFSDAYTKDKQEPLNADQIIKGGTGYAISLVDGKEIYDKSKDPDLPPEIENMPPDYSIYPQYEFAVSMSSRGCPRGCPWCHVGAKEGRCSIKTADVGDFYAGQSRIEVLDPNITACKDKHDLFQQYTETGALVNFSQGLDIRLLTDQDIEDLNAMKLRNVHFAWDDPSVDLTEKFRRYTRKAKHKPHGSFGGVYVLTNFGSTIEQDLERIYTLRDLGYDPDVRIYNKPNAAKEIRQLQRWCNNKIIFKKCPDFRDYQKGV